MAAYQKLVTITGAAGAGTNYPILLQVGESSGATGAHFTLGSATAMFPSGLGDPGDIQFRDASDVALASWVEQVTGTTPNRVAWIWIKVAADLGTSQQIKCIYNLGVSTTSDGYSVFELFDDFTGNGLNTAKWSQTAGTGGFSVAAGELTLAGSGTARSLVSVAQIGDGREVLGLVNPPTTTASYVGRFGFGDGATTVAVQNDWDTTATSEWLAAGAKTQLAARYQSAYYRMQVRRLGGAASLWVNNTQVATTASGASTAALPIPLMNVYDNNSTGKLRWIAVKKWQATEPAFSTAGAEAAATKTVLSGTVKDSANNAAARTVRVYREDTGVLVGSTTSSATTGAYTITALYSGAHTLAFYPASGESLPALVLSGVIPA